MTLENKHRADNKTLREFYEATGSKGVLWIDHRTGRIVELPVESRIRRGEGGCQLCHEQFVGMEKHGRVDFDERNLPRLVFGPGEAICDECVEWVRLLDYHAENGSVAAPRFEDGDLVLRAGTEELYEVLESRLTGIPTAGVWFPTYTCQRIEIRQGTGRILPACMGMLFEIPDCEIQPVPPRFSVSISRQDKINGEDVAFAKDHLGHRSIQSTMTYAQISDSRRHRAMRRLEKSPDFPLPS